jgi:O-antigen/teichoic acid export membrane protein
VSRALFRRFLVLLTGTTAAQLLPVVTAPVIARHYETSEFGVFGIFIAASAICSTLANLKYDNVILATRSRSLTQAVLGLSLLINLTIGALIAFGIAGVKSMGLLGDSPVIGDLLVFLPLSLLLAGGLQAMSNVALQQEQFSALARSRITAATVTAAASLVCALLHPTAQGLILASLTGQLLGAALLAWLCLQAGAPRLSWRPRRWRAVALKHWRFALFTSPADLLNASASNLPALFLGALFGTTATGAYVLSQRLLGTPLMLIGSAFSDLYRQRIGQRVAEGRPYWDASLRMLAVLAAIGLLVLASVLTIGRHAAVAFLGDHWRLVGDFADVMVSVYVMRFVVSPLTFSFYLAKRHIEDLMLQAVCALAVCAIYVIAKHSQWSMMQYLMVLSAALTIMYLIYGVRSMQFSRKSREPAPTRIGKGAL